LSKANDDVNEDHHTIIFAYKADRHTIIFVYKADRQKKRGPKKDIKDDEYEEFAFLQKDVLCSI